jgi:putative peptidoglycan lipid II flippase
VRIVVSIFYALQDTKTPVKIACISVAANIALSIVLMQYLAHGGLALATSLASMVNLALLLYLLRRRLGRLGMKKTAASVFKSALFAAAMGAGVWLLARWFVPAAGGKTLRLLAALAAGIGIYGLLHLAFRSPELGAIVALVSRRGGQKH